MKNRIILSATGLILLFIFGGYNAKSTQSESAKSLPQISYVNDEKSDLLDYCPYLEKQKGNSCPYSNGNLNNSESSCPSFDMKSECPFETDEKKSCPFLNENFERGTNSQREYETIKNRST